MRRSFKIEPNRWDIHCFCPGWYYKHPSWVGYLFSPFFPIPSRLAGLVFVHHLTKNRQTSAKVVGGKTTPAALSSWPIQFRRSLCTSYNTSSSRNRQRRSENWNFRTLAIFAIYVVDLYLSISPQTKRTSQKSSLWRETSVLNNLSSHYIPRGTLCKRFHCKQPLLNLLGTIVKIRPDSSQLGQERQRKTTGRTTTGQGAPQKASSFQMRERSSRGCSATRKCAHERRATLLGSHTFRLRAPNMDFLVVLGSKLLQTWRKRREIRNRIFGICCKTCPVWVIH